MVAAATPQRVGKSHAALPPDICAFGELNLPSSSEKPIHLQKAWFENR
jgi:hypothetical protein